MRISDWSSDVCSSDLGGPDEVEGRLPILITSDYWDADQHRTDTAIYAVVWRIEGRLLRGRMLRLKGLVLRERSDSPKRSEERRVGKGCVRTRSSRWSPYH